MVKKISRSGTWRNLVKTFGKHRVKKNVPFERKNFLPVFTDMVENENYDTQMSDKKKWFPWYFNAISKQGHDKITLHELVLFCHSSHKSRINAESHHYFIIFWRFFWHLVKSSPHAVTTFNNFPDRYHKKNRVR